MISSGADSGRWTWAGCGSKVTATEGMWCRLAGFVICARTCWWPRWTPSKFPMVTTVGPKSPGTSVGSFQMWTINLAFYCRYSFRPATSRRRNILRLPAVAVRLGRPPLVQPQESKDGQHERDETITASKQRPHSVMREGHRIEQAYGANYQHAEEFHEYRGQRHFEPCAPRFCQRDGRYDIDAGGERREDMRQRSFGKLGGNLVAGTGSGRECEDGIDRDQQAPRAGVPCVFFGYPAGICLSLGSSHFAFFLQGQYKIC